MEIAVREPRRQNRRESGIIAAGMTWVTISVKGICMPVFAYQSMQDEKIRNAMAVTFE